jgi:exopolysaccharide biosynthesis polyprenyl glycosylphosphotransferase
MRTEDPRDIQASLIAVVTDGVTIFCGFMLATWIRFGSGWLQTPFGVPQDSYANYASGAAVASILILFVYRSLGLFVRPQTGTFSDRIPRLIRATGLGILLTTVLAFAVRNVIFPFSTGVLIVSFFTISLLVLLERALLFRFEIMSARQAEPNKMVLILGTGDVAAHLMRAIADEPRLRSRVVGFLKTSHTESPIKDIPHEMIIGDSGELPALIAKGKRLNQVILTDPRLDHDRMVEILCFCERHLISFKLVPDTFRILTGNVEIEVVGDIPLLGLEDWPLDLFWNRTIKRIEDVVGAAFGLLVAAPLLAICALVIKRESSGPVFYRQERCGEKGKPFTLFKLRTMKDNAEDNTGPVWAAENDPRRTAVGAFLRRHNLDELPQLWNVLRGDMSMVGPRPERPHFVEQFKEDISQYMSRHFSKPGMTGWAQVNGLRGNTSITERVKHDLFYLENWSLALDFKIIMRTFFARKNAY